MNRGETPRIQENWKKKKKVRRDKSGETPLALNWWGARGGGRDTKKSFLKKKGFSDETGMKLLSDERAAETYPLPGKKKKKRPRK